MAAAFGTGRRGLWLAIGALVFALALWMVLRASTDEAGNLNRAILEANEPQRAEGGRPAQSAPGESSEQEGRPSADPTSMAGKASPSPPSVDGSVSRSISADSKSSSQMPPSSSGAPVMDGGLQAEASSPASEQDAAAIDRLMLSLRDYRTVMHENPVGTNREITAAMDGGNSRQSRLLPADARRNGKGELIDRWATPYFFHQLSKDDIEVRSAGPDRVMWTEDDVVGH